MKFKLVRWICVFIFTFFFNFISVAKAQTNTGLIEISDNDSLTITSDFRQLYLVFAGPYTASPSSAFGHMFILLEPNDENYKNIQLWESVNYAADVDDHSEVSTLISGVIGTLDGQFEILPFYKKIRDYSYSESRDMWLFPLKLDQEEKDRFSDFINDNIGQKTQYRFSDKNCATRVLEALSYTIEDDFSAGPLVLPQQIIEHSEIKERLSEPLFIENVESQLLDVYKTFEKRDFGIEEVEKLENNEIVRLLKTYEWLYNNSHSSFNLEKNEFIRDLRYRVGQQESEFQLSEVRRKPFNIHYPGRVGAAYNYHDKFGKSINLEFRLGLHDFEDLSATYPKFDYINLFSIDVNFNKDSFLVNELWVFHQSSRQPANNFRSPLSWTIGLGGRRNDLSKYSETEIGAFLGVGRTYSLFEDHWTISFIANIDPVYVVNDKWRVIFKPALEQRFFFSERLKALVTISSQFSNRSDNKLNIIAKSNLVYSLGSNLNFITAFGVSKFSAELSAGLKLNLSY